jgi:hypothetical protein
VSLEIHAILTEILREHAPSYAAVKNCLAQFKRGDFSTFFPLVGLRTYQHPVLQDNHCANYFTAIKPHDFSFPLKI